MNVHLYALILYVYVCTCHVATHVLHVATTCVWYIHVMLIDFGGEVESSSVQCQ